MRLYVISDLHADATTSGLDRYDEIEAGCFAAANDAARFVMTGGRALFCFLGDLCDPDTTRAFRAVSMAIDLALHLSERRVPSLWIAGNHDVIENDRGSTVLEPLASAAGFCSEPEGWICVAERPKSLRVGEAQFFVLPYVARANAYDPRLFVEHHDDFGRRPVVLGHLTVPSAERGSESDDFARGRDLVFPVEACRSRWGDRAILLNGHYHRWQVTSDGVIIPGSMARLRHDEETNEPGYLVIDL